MENQKIPARQVLKMYGSYFSKTFFYCFFLSNLILNDFLVILSSFIMCFFLYILVILVYLNFLVWFFAKDPFSNEFHETDPGGPIETEPSVS